MHNEQKLFCNLYCAVAPGSDAPQWHEPRAPETVKCPPSHTSLATAATVVSWAHLSAIALAVFSLHSQISAMDTMGVETACVGAGGTRGDM